jgi:hypothetical protein
MGCWVDFSEAEALRHHRLHPLLLLQMGDYWVEF